MFVLGVIAVALVTQGVVRPPQVFVYPVVLSIAAGIIIELGVVAAGVRFWFASRKRDRGDMVLALMISMPFVLIAIVLAPLMLVAMQGC